MDRKCSNDLAVEEVSDAGDSLGTKVSAVVVEGFGAAIAGVDADRSSDIVCRLLRLADSHSDDSCLQIATHLLRQTVDRINGFAAVHTEICHHFVLCIKSIIKILLIEYTAYIQVVLQAVFQITYNEHFSSKKSSCDTADHASRK